MPAIQDFVIALAFFIALGLLAVVVGRARQVGRTRYTLLLSIGYATAFTVFIVYSTTHVAVSRSIEIIATVLISLALLAGLIMLILRRVNH